MVPSDLFHLKLGGTWGTCTKDVLENALHACHRLWADAGAARCPATCSTRGPWRGGPYPPARGPPGAAARALRRCTAISGSWRPSGSISAGKDQKQLVRGSDLKVDLAPMYGNQRQLATIGKYIRR